MQAAVSKAISKEEQEFLSAVSLSDGGCYFPRLEQDVQIKLAVAEGGWGLFQLNAS